ARRTGAGIVGVDVSDDMLEIGRRRVKDAGLGGRIELGAARAEELPFADGAFDAVAFTYVLRYVSDPGASVGEIARVVRPGGAVSGLDFFVPTNRFVYAALWLSTGMVRR